MLKALILLLCSSVSFAFITHQDFSELPTHQKKAYLRLVQKLSVQAEESFQSTASLNYRLPSWFAFANSVEALANENGGELAVDRSCKMNSATGLTDTELVDLVLQTMNCTEIVEKGQVSKFSHVVPERIEILESELNRRSTASSSGTLRRGLKELVEVKEEIRNRGVRGGGTLSTRAATIPQTPEVRLQPRTTTVIAPTPTTAAPVASAKPEETTAVSTTTKQATLAPAQTPSAMIEKKSELNLDQVLCLYAGHIVTKSVSNKCQAQNTIANSELNSFFNFKCSSNEALCHPLVFGFISGCASDSKNECTDRKPICVSKSKSASATCLEKSQKYKGMDHLVMVLDKPELASAFNLYQRELKMICEPRWIQKARLSKRGRKDLSETCEKSNEAIQSILNIQKTKLDLKTRPGQK
jgi:hypothetical protein